MTYSPASRPVDFSHYLKVVKFQWRPIAVGAVLGLLLATGTLALVGTSYTATTDVNVTVISESPFALQRSASGLLDGATESRIASSYAVAAQAAASLGSAIAAEDLRSGTKVSVITDTTIVRISYTSTTAESARARADAIASAYLQTRGEQAQGHLSAVILHIEERVAELQRELADANTRAASSPPDSTAAQQAASDRSLATNEIESVLAAKNSLAFVSTSGGSVLNSADENVIDASPPTLPVLGSGLLAGLVMGLLVAFAMDASRRRVTGVRDVERVTDAPILAHLHDRRPTVPPTGTDRDEFRAATERIFAFLDSGLSTIALVDCGHRNSFWDVPLNLAHAFSETGRATLLVIGDGGSAIGDSTLARLGLSTSPSPSYGGHRFESADHLLHIYQTCSESADANVDSLLIALSRDVVDSSSGDDLIIIYIASDAPQATVLALGRLASALCLVITLGDTTETKLTTVLGEPALLSVDMLGSIVVPSRRRQQQPVPISAVSDLSEM